MVGGAPRVEGDGVHEFAPAAGDWLDGGLFDEGSEALGGGGVSEIEHFVSFELGGDGLDVGFDALFFGDVHVADEEVNGGTDEDGDDAEDEHDFEEGVAAEVRGEVSRGGCGRGKWSIHSRRRVVLKICIGSREGSSGVVEEGKFCRGEVRGDGVGGRREERGWVVAC